MRKLTKIITLLLTFSLFCSIAICPVLAAKNSGTAEEFFQDSRWAAGTDWSNTSTKLSNFQAKQCCAYACDFIKYVYGKNSYLDATSTYSDLNKTMPGDVLHVYIYKYVKGKDSRGNTIWSKSGSYGDSHERHWIVVMGINGDTYDIIEGNAYDYNTKRSGVAVRRSYYKWYDSDLGKYVLRMDIGSNTYWELPIYKGYSFGGIGLSKPNAPKVTAENLQNTSSLTISWSAVNGAAKYNLYRHLAGDPESDTPIASDLTSTTYQDTNLLAGKRYWYRVQAVDSSGKSSGKSDETAGYTKIAAPTISSITTSSMRLTWNKPTHATSYEILRQTDNGSWITAGTSISESYTDTNLASATRHYYRIKAKCEFSGNVWYCYSLSASETTSSGNGSTGSILKGDANGDGKINSKDAAAIAKYAVGIIAEINFENADVNGDGKINSKDAALVAKYVVGIFRGSRSGCGRIAGKLGWDIIEAFLPPRDSRPFQ